MKSYYAYIRVSTVRQGEFGSSLSEQRDAISHYAAAHNLTIGEWFEETETAAKQGRRLFTRMIAALEGRKADGVILHKVDRGARNLWDWARLQGLLDLGVEVHFVHESLDLNSRGGRLSANLQAVIAADYIWNLRDEVRKGVRGRLKQGLLPLPAPVGYLNCGKAKPKEIDPVKGPLVRRAFELYATGQYTFATLRPELAAIGLTTRTGKPLSKCGVTTMLRNPFYIGLIRIRAHAHLYQGVHAPLISHALFQRVQDVLDGRLAARAIKHDFKYRRLLMCAQCDLALIGERQKGHIYYRCHTRGCSSALREEAIDEKLDHALRPFQIEPTELDELRSQIGFHSKSGAAAREHLMQGVRLSLAAIEGRLQRLTDAFIDQLLDRESYKERHATLLHERVELTERLKALTDGTESPADECTKFLELASNLWLSHESGLPHEKREMLRLATSNLAVDGKNLVVELQNPFRIVAHYRKLPFGAPHRDRPRTDTKRLAGELWEYFRTSKGPNNNHHRRAA